MFRSLSLLSGSIFLLQMLAPTASAQSQAVSAPVCVYDSRDYSDGAYICAQKAMMLNCQSDGTKATWKIVTDKDLNDRCIVPVMRSNIAEPRIRRRHAVRPVTARVYADPNAKCFHFNGKRYCE